MNGWSGENEGSAQLIGLLLACIIFITMVPSLSAPHTHNLSLSSSLPFVFFFVFCFVVFFVVFFGPYTPYTHHTHTHTEGRAGGC